MINKAFWLLDCPRGNVGLTLESREGAVAALLLVEPVPCPMCGAKDHAKRQVSKEQFEKELDDC